MPDPVAPSPNGVTAAPVTPAPDDKLKGIEKERDQYKRDAIDYRRHLEREKKERATLGQKLSEYEKLKKDSEGFAAERERWTRREAAIKAAFGEKYNELVPDNLTAADVERMLKQREDAWNAQRESEKKKAEADAVEARRRADADARAELKDRAAQFLEQSAEDYPVFKGKPHMAAVLAERIEQHYHSTTRKDETGRIIPGQVLTAKEAADGLEKEMLDLRDELNKHAKYAAKAAAVEASQSKSSVGVQSNRPNLTNDLTGNTAPKPKRTEAERLKAADEIFRKSRKG